MDPRFASPYGDNRVIKTSEDRENGNFEKIVIFLSYLLVIIFFPIAIFFCLISIPEYQRVVVLRLGRYRKKGMIGPGVYFIVPCIDTAIRVDMRMITFKIPAQDILTKDSVTVAVDGVIFIRIQDPLKAIIQVVDAIEASKFLAQTTLRTVAGTKNLTELLTSRSELTKEIQHLLDEATDAWGIKVVRVEVKDIIIPISLQRALAQEAEALREAKAKIASAEGEAQAAKALKAASDVMKESPLTLQLRYMQTLNFITSGQSSTIVYPVPVDMLPPGIL